MHKYLIQEDYTILIDFNFLSNFQIFELIQEKKI